MKPGYQTTEFWLALVAKVFSLAVTLGVLSASAGAELSTAASNAVVGVFAIVSFAGVAKAYVAQRGELKQTVLREAAKP